MERLANLFLYCLLFFPNPNYFTYESNEANKNTYGALYNWYAVDTKKICPAGWHVPNDSEWSEMEDYLINSGYNFDGTPLDNKIAKSLATSSGWDYFSLDGAVGNTDYDSKRNATGFSGLAGGHRKNDGLYYYQGLNGDWWTSSEYTDNLV